MIGFSFALMELVQIWQTYLEASAIQTSIERQELFRQSILSAYAKGETAEYAYRPNLDWKSPENQFTTLAVVHLPTGKRKDTILSPEYMGYGLWNLVDFEKGVVYHHGIGMDPTRYTYSAARTLYPYGKVKTIETSLVAMPISIPR